MREKNAVSALFDILYNYKSLDPTLNKIFI